MKILIVWTLFIVSTIAEPPVDNRYLPPQRGSGGGLSPPSQTYGVPGAPGFGQRQTSAIFRGRQSSSYNRATSRRPSTQYGAPNLFKQPTNQYGAPSQYNQPSTQYGAPGQYNQPSTQYGAPSQYNQPSNQYGAPSQYNQPSNQYGAPSQYKQPSNQYGLPVQSRGLGKQSSRLQTPAAEYGVPSIGAPSQQYGAPGGGNGDAQQYSQSGSFGVSSDAYKAQEQSRQYLPPGRGGYDDGSNGEPADYSFEYMVKDDQSGNDFGHRESRQGDRAEGLYYVLLPDGRKQTVEYEADQDGYKPRISYEDVGVGGYDRNSQARDAYQNQGGPY